MTIATRAQRTAIGLWTDVRARPSLGPYLGALLLLPVAGLAPLGVLSEHASFTDVLIAAATTCWLFERSGTPVRLRRLGPRGAVFGALASFLVLSALSATLVADDRTDGAIDVLIAAELVAIALLTADHARCRRSRNLVLGALLVGAILTIALAVLGVLLLSLGVESSLAGPYGEQLIAADAYARVAAGFHSPPLLASYCVVAAAAVAMESDVAPRTRRAVELALGVVVILTLSRAILGFFVAFLIRWAATGGSARARVLAVAAIVSAVAAMGALSTWRFEIDPARPSELWRTVPEPANRREALTTSLDTLGSNPLLGIGPGGLPGVNSTVPVRAHLTPLNVAATVGVPALVALCAALVLLWRGRSRPTDIALWSGFAGVAVDALGQDVEHFRHVWVLIGLAAASMVPRPAGEPAVGARGR